MLIIIYLLNFKKNFKKNEYNNDHNYLKSIN